MSGALRKVMVIFAAIFVLMGITISQAFMLPGFLLALLYFAYDIFSQRDYEYTMENGQLTIDVIYGKKYRKTAHVLKLEEMEVKSDFIKIPEGVSRINLKLKSIDGTEINGMGPKISAEKVQELMEKLDTLKEGDVLFLAGSIPSSMPDDMYEKIMARLDGRGVMIVVDATRDLLVNVLKYHPFLVKPNNHELGEIFGVELKTRQDVIPYGKKLQEKGARNVLISMAGEGAVLVAEDGQVFEKPAPKGTLVNGVGAGDSMVAGFMAGWMEKQDYEYAFHMGISAGSASAFSENLATKEEIQAVYKQVTEG